MAPDVPSNRLARVLGGMLLGMGALHFAVPKPFDEIVPPEIAGALGTDARTLTYASGVAEVGIGAGLLVPQTRRLAAGSAAALFVAVFPGNIAQLTEHRDAFGLTSDTSRAVRLVFQPVLVVWAVWSTGAWRWWRRRRVPPPEQHA